MHREAAAAGVGWKLDGHLIAAELDDLAELASDAHSIAGGEVLPSERDAAAGLTPGGSVALEDGRKFELEGGSGCRFVAPAGYRKRPALVGIARNGDFDPAFTGAPDGNALPAVAHANVAIVVAAADAHDGARLAAHRGEARDVRSRCNHLEAVRAARFDAALAFDTEVVG